MVGERGADGPEDVGISLYAWVSDHDISVMIVRQWPLSQEGFLFYILQKNTTDNKHMLWLFCGKHLIILHILNSVILPITLGGEREVLFYHFTLDVWKLEAQRG